jgi:hypothetical protein
VKRSCIVLRMAVSGVPRLYLRVLIPTILQRSERCIRADIGEANPSVGTRFGWPSTWYYLDQQLGSIVRHPSYDASKPYYAYVV